jgi:aspartate/methionine/tyrosine aminotransferase
LTGPEEIIANNWAYHDYTSITASILSNKVAEFALQPDLRKKILSRNIKMLNENLEVTLEWADKHKDMLEFVPPKAGGMVFVKYKYPINSTELSNWLRIEKGVFILPGDVFDMDYHFRLGIGAQKSDLLKGYEILTRSLRERFDS